MVEQNEKQEKRRTINVTITSADKKTLHKYATENDNTVVGIIHEFAEKMRVERNSKK